MAPSLSEQYLAWRRQEAVGCVFARLIALRPADYMQTIVTVASNSTPNRIAGNIARRIDQFVNDKAVAAAALLLPGLTTLDDLAKVALALNDRPKWSVTRTLLPTTSAGPMVAFHVVREIPFGAKTCPSAALVLGAFQDFPPTRRAPVTALEMYVGEPRPEDPKSGTPTTKAHLAHIELNLPNQHTFDRMWDSTRALRLKALGGDDNRAKANITFLIPLELAKQLECVP